jgi:hypothetical protein
LKGDGESESRHSFFDEEKCCSLVSNQTKFSRKGRMHAGYASRKEYDAAKYAASPAGIAGKEKKRLKQMDLLAAGVAPEDVVSKKVSRKDYDSEKEYQAARFRPASMRRSAFRSSPSDLSAKPVNMSRGSCRRRLLKACTSKSVSLSSRICCSVA